MNLEVHLVLLCFFIRTRKYMEAKCHIFECLQLQMLLFSMKYAYLLTVKIAPDVNNSLIFLARKGYCK